MGGYSYKGKEYNVEGFLKSNKPQASSNRGSEIVEDWKCSKNCPVKILDEQSGIRKGWQSQNHNGFNMYGGNSFNSSSTSRSGFHVDYNDTGGASRFFYNAQGWASAIQYLMLLSGVPCLNLTKFNIQS